MFMKLLIFLLFVLALMISPSLFVLCFFIFIFYISRKSNDIDELGQLDVWENHADSYLDCVKKYGRVTFKNLILDSYSGNTDHTEIDELIISPRGIFCIEYKAHRGVIFGTARNKIWTQCKYDGKKPVHNPLHQNYKHVRALHDLLGTNIKSEIKSYVIYTNATDVHVDSDRVFMGVEAMEAEISKYHSQIYSMKECRRILKILAIANVRSRGLRETHVREVRAYLATL